MNYATIFIDLGAEFSWKRKRTMHDEYNWIVIPRVGDLFRLAAAEFQSIEVVMSSDMGGFDPEHVIPTNFTYRHFITQTLRGRLRTTEKNEMLSFTSSVADFRD